jgi:hypothetical protein
MKQTVFAISPAILAVSALLAQRAGADEVRHTTFPGVLIGTWAPSAELCAAKDKSNITIAADGYSTADGKCSVGWIVETAGSRGPKNLDRQVLHRSKTLSALSVRPLGKFTSAAIAGFGDEP